MFAHKAECSSLGLDRPTVSSRFLTLTGQLPHQICCCVIKPGDQPTERQKESQRDEIHCQLRPIHKHLHSTISVVPNKQIIRMTSNTSSSSQFEALMNLGLPSTPALALHFFDNRIGAERQTRQVFPRAPNDRQSSASRTSSRTTRPVRNAESSRASTIQVHVGI
jgi:hypothetical protein